MGCSRTPIQKKIRNFDEKAVGKTQKAVGKPKKPLENQKSCWKNFFFKKPLNLAADSRYPPPPYPRWVGGLRPLIQKMGIGVGKSVNLPPLGESLFFPTEGNDGWDGTIMFPSAALSLFFH